MQERKAKNARIVDVHFTFESEDFMETLRKWSFVNDRHTAQPWHSLDLGRQFRSKHCIFGTEQLVLYTNQKHINVSTLNWCYRDE